MPLFGGILIRWMWSSSRIKKPCRGYLHFVEAWNFSLLNCSYFRPTCFGDDSSWSLLIAAVQHRLDNDIADFKFQLMCCSVRECHIVIGFLPDDGPLDVLSVN